MKNLIKVEDFSEIFKKQEQKFAKTIEKWNDDDIILL